MTRRKLYQLNDKVTFSQVEEITKMVEARFPFLHCRINVHTLEFEVVNKEIRSEFPEIAVHNLCRPIWDVKISIKKKKP